MEQLTLRGTLKGHSGWVTQIATTPQDPNQILSASRGMYTFCLGSIVATIWNCTNVLFLQVIVFV